MKRLFILLPEHNISSVPSGQLSYCDCPDVLEAKPLIVVSEALQPDQVRCCTTRVHVAQAVTKQKTTEASALQVWADAEKGEVVCGTAAGSVEGLFGLMVDDLCKGVVHLKAKGKQAVAEPEPEANDGCEPPGWEGVIVNVMC